MHLLSLFAACASKSLFVSAIDDGRSRAALGCHTHVTIALVKTAVAGYNEEVLCFQAGLRGRDAGLACA